MRRFALVVVLTGCGRVDFDAIPRGSASADAAGDSSGDGASGDAAPLVSCDPAAPFTSIDPVPGVNVAGAYDSTFTPMDGELTAYFYSNRAGNHDLYLATRSDTASAWTVAPINNLNTASIEKEPSPSQDGQLLVFNSNRPPADAGGDFYYATFDGANWNLGAPISNLNSTMEERHPFFQLDASDMWFSSNRLGNFGLYHTISLGGGAFATPTPMTDLDVVGQDTDVAIVASGGLVMYFRSNRPGGPGGIDIWLATRATIADTWVAQTVVTEVDSPQLDTPTWISRDLCRLYISSGRTDASDIYVASRTPP